MSAVIDEQQDMGWWAYTWQEHRGLIIAFSLLALSLIVWKIHGAPSPSPKKPTPSKTLFFLLLNQRRAPSPPVLSGFMRAWSIF